MYNPLPCRASHGNATGEGIGERCGDAPFEGKEQADRRSLLMTPLAEAERLAMESLKKTFPCNPDKNGLRFEDLISL